MPLKIIISFKNVVVDFEIKILDKKCFKENYENFANFSSFGEEGRSKKDSKY
jgi:hypothetical protein